jgi:hypothetical protein
MGCARVTTACVAAHRAAGRDDSRARSEGKRLGRPPIAPKLETAIREALNKPGRIEGVRKTTRFSTRDGQEMPGRFSLPSLPLRENGESRVARTPISSFRLKQFARRNARASTTSIMLKEQLEFGPCDWGQAGIEAEGPAGAVASIARGPGVLVVLFVSKAIILRAGRGRWSSGSSGGLAGDRPRTRWCRGRCFR